MAIIIENMKGPADGICEYRVRINKRVLFTFEHDRRQGLADCFRRAAAKAQECEFDQEIELMERVIKMMEEIDAN